MQVNLNWTDNSADETEFRIERKTSGGVFAQIATVGAGVQTYADTTVSSGVAYVYRVRAANARGASAFSNESSISTPSAPFDPYTLANQMWMFESTGITPQVDNTDLSTWPDDSTNTNNGNDIIFPSTGDPGGIKPKYRTNIFNGTVPAVQVIDTAEGEITAYNPTTASTSVTAYFVLDYQTVDQASGIGLMFYPYDVVFSLGGNYIAPYVCSDLVTTDKVGFEEDSSEFDTGAATNGKQLLTFKWNKAAGTATVYRNGTQIGSASGLGTEGWKFQGLITWFSLLGGTTGQYVGYVGAMFAFSTVHSDTDRSNVETYLINKYGL